MITQTMLYTLRTANEAKKKAERDYDLARLAILEAIEQDRGQVVREPGDLAVEIKKQERRSIRLIDLVGWVGKEQADAFYASLTPSLATVVTVFSAQPAAQQG